MLKRFAKLPLIGNAFGAIYSYGLVFYAFTFCLFVYILAFTKSDFNKLYIALFTVQSAVMLIGTVQAAYQHIATLQDKANAVPPERIVTQIGYAASVHEPVVMPVERGEYVYIVQDIDVTRYCKIGHTNDLYRRLGRFEVTLPFRIHCIHVIRCEDRRVAEGILHRRLYKQHVSGEWFRLSDADIEQLKGINFLWNNGTTGASQ